ncbi:hypothetical protein Tneu_0428 [Pyrobaculum neutrophilum V24Sta]|uniref:Uncharacterized protein n=1 Tax=Pyrobaculum neutrophilum (strain DSM 2338 / JCM 9278 / NBRC 100436 / V24Sta) TaxID=444157 RepID=B1YBZ2_PYRNV|nr:hypothetical protein Tneu_0428 [Pyrobaculum neutrophilum V24Sta]
MLELGGPVVLGPNVTTESLALWGGGLKPVSIFFIAELGKAQVDVVNGKLPVAGRVVNVNARPKKPRIAGYAEL